MTHSIASPLIGKWRIAEMDQWDGYDLETIAPMRVVYDSEPTPAGKTRFRSGPIRRQIPPIAGFSAAC